MLRLVTMTLNLVEVYYSTENEIKLTIIFMI